MSVALEDMSTALKDMNVAVDIKKRALDFSKFFEEILTVDNILNFVGLLAEIALLFFVTFLILSISRRAVHQYVKKVVTKEKHDKKLTPLVQTAAPVLISILRLVILLISGLMLLRIIGVDITPIILSFSAIGVAVALASQNLVKDVLNGISMLFEGNLAVGDYVTLAGVMGTVEDISLRLVHVRELGGTLHAIPFSAIVTIVNHSRDYQSMPSEIVIDHEENAKKVENIMHVIFEKMITEDPYKDMVIEGITPIRLMSIDLVGCTVATFAKVKPDPFRTFEREMRKRLQVEIEKKNIKMPDVQSLAG